MAVKDKTLLQIIALQGTRGAAGMRYDEQDSFPSYEYLMRMLHQLQLAAAASASLMVCEDDTAANAVFVLPGRCNFGGTVLTYAGGTLSGGSAMVNNATTYVWAVKPESTLVINRGISTGGWPMATHIKLAEVTMSAGVITNILDLRAQYMLTV